MNSLLSPALVPGEQILWQGHAFRGILVRPIDWFLVPLSLSFGGFALVVLARAGPGIGDVFLALICLMFLLFGLYGAVVRFVVDAIMRQKIAYFVTNKRVLMVDSRNGSTTLSLNIACLPALDIEERADGSGTIRFDRPVGWWTGNLAADKGGTMDQIESNLDMVWQPMLDATPQFIRIANVRAVFDLIKSQTGG